jgi:hypothetical protein
MTFGTRLKRIKRVDTERYRVSVVYEDGFVGTVDLGFIFGEPGDKPLVLEILRGQLFGRCFIESGGLAWPNGYELCPDAIRAWIIEQRGRRAA